MSDVRVAMPKSPKRIKITDGDALLEHARVLQLRSQGHDLIDRELRSAQQRVEEAKLKLREAEITAEQVRLALDAIELQEQKAVEAFYVAVRKTNRQIRDLTERYGGDVSFTFDSDGRSVWVVALFGKDAPPAVRTVPEDEVSWSFESDDGEDADDEEGDDES